MASEFSGKTVVITGGGSGMGRAVAHRLGAQGARVVLLDINGGNLKVVEDELIQAGAGCLTFVVDVSDAAQVQAAADETKKAFGPADVLVNCAATETHAGFLETSEEDWDRTLDVNLKGMWLTCRAFGRDMADNGGGTIVNIASDAAHVGIANLFAYCVSKGGVVELTRAMAMDGIALNIRVNCISPGPTNTPMGYTSGTLKGLVGEELERYKQQVLTANPMGIVTEPEDIAAAVEFLASHRARLITGAVLPVDGGLLASRPFAKWPGPTK